MMTGFANAVVKVGNTGISKIRALEPSVSHYQNLSITFSVSSTRYCSDDKSNNSVADMALEHFVLELMLTSSKIHPRAMSRTAASTAMSPCVGSCLPVENTAPWNKTVPQCLPRTLHRRIPAFRAVEMMKAMWCLGWSDSAGLPAQMAAK